MYVKKLKTTENFTTKELSEIEATVNSQIFRIMTYCYPFNCHCYNELMKMTEHEDMMKDVANNQ